jgi:hypothetical protein
MYELESARAHGTEHGGPAPAVDPGRSSRTARLAPAHPPTTGAPPTATGDGGSGSATGKGDDPYSMHLAPTAVVDRHGPAEGAHPAHHGHHGHLVHHGHGATRPSDAHGEGQPPDAARSFGAWLASTFSLGARPVTSPNVPGPGIDQRHPTPAPPGQAPAPPGQAPAPPGQAPAPPGQAPAPPGQAPAPPGQAPAPTPPPRPRIPVERLAADAAAALDARAPTFLAALRAVHPAGAATAAAMLRTEAARIASALGGLPTAGTRTVSGRASVGLKSDGEVQVMHQGHRLGTLAGERAAIVHAQITVTADGHVTVTTGVDSVPEHTLYVALGDPLHQPVPRETAADTELQTGALLTHLGELQGRR